MKPKKNITTRVRRLLADTATPVSLYLRLRDRYEAPLLLESADYHSRTDSYSFICLSPIANFRVQDGRLRIAMDGEAVAVRQLGPEDRLADELQGFAQRFAVDCPPELRSFNGFFGHTNYDAVRYFETIELDRDKPSDGLPDMQYSLYRFVIVINHFNEEMFLLENLMEGAQSQLDALEATVRSRDFGAYGFQRTGEETAGDTPEAFLEQVRRGKAYCQAGEVFQVVFSRRFSQPFQGDEFNVYRALRSINPSPYLFYFDYGNYRLFGSSPEAQLRIADGKAQLHPIAGTFRRTGDDQEDAAAAQRLAADPKENAEHVMLVDLARNDLGRSATAVNVSRFREVQYFSHVLHLVSHVDGDLPPTTNPIQVLADTFPAGTLSGAPKYRAMQLIDRHENRQRGFYGGAIGMIGLDGNLNHAIMIRSFLSRDNRLHYQAGAGIVVDSQPESELKEVDNKLAALRRALTIAEEI